MRSVDVLPDPEADGGPAAARVLVQSRGVGRTYGSGDDAVVAVHDVNCVVRHGDRIAVVGASGSGKSTLLHLLAGLETATTGAVDWPGWAWPVEQIGLVFQAPSLIPSLTVLENVALPLVLANESSEVAASRAHDALAALQLAWLGDRLPQELSGGQAQRAVIARVIARGPSLILADEPTSRLDRATADHVAEVLIEASDLVDAALVVATHDSRVAARLDHTWPMHDGRLHTTGGGS